MQTGTLKGLPFGGAELNLFNGMVKRQRLESTREFLNLGLKIFYGL